jgi:hypothetical protein
LIGPVGGGCALVVVVADSDVGGGQISEVALSFFFF